MINHLDRTAIRQDGNEVVLRCADPMTGERMERRFWAPAAGGNVREVNASRPGTLGQQVCGGLTHRGWTLSVASPSQLLPLIRTEWAKARRTAPY